MSSQVLFRTCSPIGAAVFCGYETQGGYASLREITR